MDALRALLGYEYSMGSWFTVPGDEVRMQRSGKPFGKGKARPVVLATPVRPDAVLYPRSTKPGHFKHDPHRHEEGPCKIDKPGKVLLRVPVAVEEQLLNEECYSCKEPEDSPLLDAIREELRP